MRVSQVFIAFLGASPAFSFPFLAGDEAELKHMLEHARRAAEAEAESRAAEQQKRQVLGGLVGTIGALTNTVAGLAGSVVAAVDLDNARPEPGYEFKAPGPNDSRGPCPGLNLLANYGYLPRDGHVNFGQVVEATSRGFNMATDLSSLLATFAVLADGDLATESWYLGAGSGNVGGLNRHSTVEADISPNREDFYNGCGDNHHLSSYRFKQHVGFVAEGGTKQFDMASMAKQWAANSKFSQVNNPYLYFFPFPSIVSLGAFPFYPNFFGNGTYGAGGVPNYDSISSIIGAQYNKDTGNFDYVPERWPKNWYRRSAPYGAVQAVRDILLHIYPANPVVMAIPQIGTPNLTPETVLCDIYQGINSIAPLGIAQSGQDLGAAVTWALSKLAPFFAPSVLGCSASTLSPNVLYNDSNAAGGPKVPPPGVYKNTGNNVYGKAYFTTAPSKQPNCQ